MRLYRLGDAGDAVRDIQGRLLALGYDVDITGELTLEAESAVRAFQSDRGLTADGVVGPETWRVLYEAGYRLGDRLLLLRRPFMRGEDVSELRPARHFGFDPGKIDSIFGPGTERAVLEFQRNRNLTEDGSAGPEVLTELRLLVEDLSARGASWYGKRSGFGPCRRAWWERGSFSMPRAAPRRSAFVAGGEHGSYGVTSERWSTDAGTIGRHRPSGTGKGRTRQPFGCGSGRLVSEPHRWRPGGDLLLRQRSKPFHAGEMLATRIAVALGSQVEPRATAILPRRGAGGDRGSSTAERRDRSPRGGWNQQVLRDGGRAADDGVGLSRPRRELSEVLGDYETNTCLGRAPMIRFFSTPSLKRIRVGMLMMS